MFYPAPQNILTMGFHDLFFISFGLNVVCEFECDQKKSS